MYYNTPNFNNDRQFFVPFLLGGLAGSAVVGLSRPRPVFVNQPPYYPMPYPRPYPYNQGGYYNYSSGGYY